MHLSPRGSQAFPALLEGQRGGTYDAKGVTAGKRTAEKGKTCEPPFTPSGVSPYTSYTRASYNDAKGVSVTNEVETGLTKLFSSSSWNSLASGKSLEAL